MSAISVHGRQICRECFSGCNKTANFGSWALLNNPGYWGSSNPEILILGFSKGLKQAKAFESEPFESVAFKGMRQRLKDALVSIEVISPDLDIDSLFTAHQQRFGSASLLRCTVSLDGKTSGKLIGNMFKSSPIPPAVTCSSKYLKYLPDHLKLILLLSTDETYIEGCKELVRKMHHDTYREINSVSYKAAGVYWVHISHPSLENGWHMKWVKDPPVTTSGRKRSLAQKVVAAALA